MTYYRQVVACCVFFTLLSYGLGIEVKLFSTDSWSVKNANNTFQLKGTVPGGIYSDLFKAGILNGSIYYRFNDVNYRWVAYENWTYSVNFTVSQVDPKKNYETVFYGLDGHAQILLNGQKVGNAVNTFVRYRFGVAGILNQGNNLLEIKFESPIVSGRRLAAQSNHTIPPNCNPPDYHGECHVNFLRRMPASYGWDWGLAMPSVGIWKQAEIVAYRQQDLRIHDVQVLTTKSVDRRWNVLIEVYYETALKVYPKNVEGRFQLTLRTEGGQVAFLSELISLNSSSKDVDLTQKFNLSVPESEVKLWWPNGYGEQNLYNLTITFRNDYGSDSKSVLIGFREAELVQDYVNATNTKMGRNFYFRINGVPIFAKGLNYIPHSIFLEEAANRKKITTLLFAVHEANMNMVRVWGGGIYADDFFYEECDRLGIMVWQDMMFACSLYPADEVFLSNVRQEVGQQIKRLQHHPSIVAWAGNNENEAALRGDWYNSKKNFTLYAKEYVKLYVNTVKEEVSRYDNTRPFLTSSPSNGVQSDAEGYIAENPYDPLYGDVHYYYYLSNAWLSDDYPLARFSSEYGFQSLPSLASFRKVASEKDLRTFNSRFFLHRQHQPLGSVYLLYQIVLQFGPPDLENLTKIIYLSQINQAWIMKQQTEWYRRWRTALLPDGRGRTMGAMYWQLNDIWQAPSWSSIEFDGKWKMLHYYAKKFFAPTIVTAHQNYGGDISVSVVSDLLEDTPDVTVAIVVFSGWTSWIPHLIFRKDLPVEKECAIEVYRTTVQAVLDACDHQRRSANCFVKLNITSSKSGGLIHENFLFPKPLRLVTGLPRSGVQVRVKLCQEKLCTLEVKVNAISLFVWLDANDIPGHFSDNGFIMTEPKKEVQFYAEGPLLLDELQASLSVVVYNDV